MNRIAVAGPDGSGKSTLCRKLQDHFNNSELIHAVKHRNHFLPSTNLGYKWWQRAKRLGGHWERLFKYHVFYPLEYLENLKRFTLSGKTIIYDRHPIDRVILKFELSNNKNTFKKKVLNRYELLMREIWAQIYLHTFPKVDYLFVLLPTPELCMERSQGHYKSKKKAERKITAYKRAIDLYKKKKLNVIPIFIENDTSKEQVFINLMAHIKQNEE